MHGIANKRMLEATRLNSTIAGYCVHALVGGDWVLGAGLLDLWRNPKTLVYEMTKEANQEQITPIRILPRNVYAEKGAQLEVHGVSELTSEKVTVSVKISSKKGVVVYQNNFSSEFSNGISTLLSTQLNTLNLEGTYTVNVEVKNTKGKVITSNYQSFDVFQEKQLKTPSTKIAVVDFEKSLTKFLDKQNIDYVPFTNELNLDIPVFIGKSLKNNEIDKTRNRKSKITC